MKASIIIVNYNLNDSVSSLVDSINKWTTGFNYEIIIVDNHSDDNSIEFLENKYSNLKVIFLDQNYGFGYANNIGMKHAKGTYFVLINPDCLLIDNSILHTINFLEKHPEIGLAGHSLLNEDGTIQYSARKFPNIWEDILRIFGLAELNFKFHNKVTAILCNNDFYYTDFVYGSCMFIKRAVYEKIGGFDEKIFLFAEETDLCYRVYKNTDFKISIYLGTKMIHADGKITNKNLPQRIKLSNESKLYFYNKHYSKYHVLLLRSVNILIFIIRFLLQCFNLPLKIKYCKIYSYLIKFYYKNNMAIRRTV